MNAELVAQLLHNRTVAAETLGGTVAPLTLGALALGGVFALLTLAQCVHLARERRFEALKIKTF